MEFRFEKSFVRDFKKVKDKNLAKEILECIQKVSEASYVNQISNIKKLQDTNQPIEFGRVIIVLELLLKKIQPFLLLLTIEKIFTENFPNNIYPEQYRPHSRLPGFGKQPVI